MLRGPYRTPYTLLAGPTTHVRRQLDDFLISYVFNSYIVLWSDGGKVTANQQAQDVFADRSSSVIVLGCLQLCHIDLSHRVWNIEHAEKEGVVRLGKRLGTGQDARHGVDG